MDPRSEVAGILHRGWWAVLVRGLAAVAFAVLTWIQPQISLTALVLLFGVYSLLDGIFGMWMGITGRKMHEDWWVLFLGGLIGITVGILTLLVPEITALALLFYIAIWAVAIGALQIILAIRLRKVITGEWFLILGGLASVVFGVLLMARPAAGALAVLSLIAAFAFVYGILLVALAIRARSFMKRLGSRGPVAVPAR